MLEVINVQILTLATKEGLPDDRAKPMIRFELTDGRDFFMVNIPYDIARNIALFLSDQPTPDSRLQVHDLIGELALVERVEIDLFVPNSDVYQATIQVLPEGFERAIRYSMVPSHATLLAVVNDAPIFVADELIKQSIDRSKENF
ncbi:MAG: bifunctional nuclease family protein [Candidatus Heimdallarchaeota archaeon]|nr:bifunctional nuclease family protein [Candidatus Heimdallarchaeota archaeon]